MLFIFYIAIISLLIGSFLNVVIYRLPIMLQNQWQSECREYLNLTIKTKESQQSTKIFNLSLPRSHCPYCKNKIAILDNIPVISFIFLKARCRHCYNKISWCYPIIELLTMILSTMIAYRFKLSLQTIAGCLLTWTLITQAAIDLKHTFIPDNITIPILWLGLLANVISIFQSADMAILGAISGYISLYSIFWIFKLCTGKDGMGHGDFKMLAMLGAWLGWQSLPLIILLSSTLGTFTGIYLILFKQKSKNSPIPFGPFLAIAGWISLMYGQDINNYYFKWIGIYN